MAADLGGSRHGSFAGLSGGGERTGEAVQSARLDGGGGGWHGHESERERGEVVEDEDPRGRGDDGGIDSPTNARSSTAHGHPEVAARQPHNHAEKDTKKSEKRSNKKCFFLDKCDSSCYNGNITIKKNNDSRPEINIALGEDKRLSQVEG